MFVPLVFSKAGGATEVNTVCLERRHRVIVVMRGVMFWPSTSQHDLKINHFHLICNLEKFY